MAERHASNIKTEIIKIPPNISSTPNPMAKDKKKNDVPPAEYIMDNNFENGTCEENSVVFKRRLGLMNGVTIIVGSIIGSGIFIAPSGVFIETKSIGMSLVIWAICGILSTIGALCYAELGTSITRSGGDYAYLLTAFGPLVGFLRLWVALVIIRPTTQAIVALTFAQYTAKPFFENCEPPASAVQILAGICLCLLTAINCISVKLSMKIQDIFTAGKVLALIFIILAGIYHMGTGRLENFVDPWSGEYTVSSLGFACYNGLFAFGGWNYLNFVTGELKDPYKNLPRAIWIAMPLVTAVYVLVNLAYFAVVTKFEMEHSSAVAVTFGNKVFGPLAFTVPIFVALSTFGGVNGILFTSARLFATGAQEGHLPKFFQLYHVKNQTPIPSLIFTCVMSILMILTADVFVLINYFSSVLWLSVAACIVGLLWLRIKKPDMPRPIKVNIALPITFIICCAVLVILPSLKKPMNLIYGILITLAGIPFYYASCITRNNSPAWYSKISQKVLNFCKAIFNATIIEDNDNILQEPDGQKQQYNESSDDISNDLKNKEK